MPEDKPPLSPEARKRLDELLAHIRSFTEDDEREHFHVGADVAAIDTEDLARKVGYRSLNDLIKTELQGHKRTQLMLYASVARAFSLETTDKHGVTKLGKLLTLRNVLNLEKLPDPPDDFTVDIPGNAKKGEGKRSKRVADCTAADLQRAIRLARGDDDKPAYPPEIQELIERVRALIDANVGDENPITIKVEVRDGKPFFTLGNIPAEMLSTLGSGLESV